MFEDIATTPWLLIQASSYYYSPNAWIHYRQRACSIMDSVRRQPSLFDAAKHNDMAQALRGYRDDLRNCRGALDPSVDYYVADFCAKEFTKTAIRIMRAEQTETAIPLSLAMLIEFRSLWEACSPIPFEQLTGHYLRRLRLIRYVMLHYSLQKSQGATFVDRRKILPNMF